MINEIYIDNFRCLVNFRIQPGEFQLWLGDNGSGKTSTLDALRKVQGLLRGGHVQDIFQKTSLTTWDKRQDQTIGLTLTVENENYDYMISIEHSDRGAGVRIKREELKWNGSTFFLFDGKDVHLYRINGATEQAEEGTSFTADWSRSVIPTVAERDDNYPLLRFREEVDRWLIIQPDPLVVKEVADSEARYLLPHAENFAPWCSHVMQEIPDVGFRAKEHLEHVLPGFEQLSLKEAGEVRKLTATFRINDKDHDFDFANLSDGQRQLIVLYTVLEYFRAGGCTALIVDEPDNFVSLREIQPWVDSLNDLCDDEGRQAIIISHHPEIINKMAGGDELWFSREEGAHVQIKPYPTVPGLTPAETMARGWDDE